MKECVILYKYVPLAHVVDAIENNRLFLNNGERFNDPFELTIINKNKTLEKINGLHILCLTNSFRKKLIWSHYAESHEGVCLAVKVPKSLVYPICYTTKRLYYNSDIDKILKSNKIKPKKNLCKGYSDLNETKKIAYIKDSKWSYEKEYRIVFDSDDESGLIQDNGAWYMSVKIVRIYLGVNFKGKSDNGQKIIKSCKKNNIKIKQMCLSDTDYSIKVERNKR